MPITDPLVLPADVILVPVADLPAQAREQLKNVEGDFAITRPRSRTPSKVLDADAALLLGEFRTPKTIAQAVIGYSRARGADPEQTLADAFPIIERFMKWRLLVPADSESAREIEASFEVGATVAGFEIVKLVQVLEDTELYQARGAGVGAAALKIVRPECGRNARRMMEREEAVLKHLDGCVSPRLFEAGAHEGRPYLAIEWCHGVNAAAAAGRLRLEGGAKGRGKLLTLCRSILDAYARLHARGVIHSDVHPRNLMVADEGVVKIIDYGLARLTDDSGKWGKAHRGGIASFFVPEYAAAARGGQKSPASSEAGEQYSLACLLYFLLAGADYLEFSPEKDEMMRQIAEDAPLPFTAQGVPAWAEVEEILSRALAKEPRQRFPSVADFAARLSEVEAPPEDEPAFAGAPPAAASPVDCAPALALLETVLWRVGSASPLFASGFTTGPTCSVNYGAAGVAYALYRIACVRNSPPLLALADAWASKAERRMAGDEAAFYNGELELTPETVGRVSPYHTAGGVHAVQAAISHALGDFVSQQAAVDAFIRSSTAPCENLDLTLGRSGPLLAASALLDTMSDSDLLNGQALVEFGQGLARGIWDEVEAFAPIRVCAELPYLGIAHGWAGVLYATMRWCRSSSDPPPAQLEARLEELADMAEPAGRGVRWRRKVRLKRHDRAPDYVPGWCNGSAGFVHLWTLAHSLTGRETYLKLAELAAWDALEDEEVIGDLCCGAAGRAYALLNLYKHTREEHWLHRARQLANTAASSVEKFSLSADSLYKGKIGVAVLAADLAEPEGACMPFFEQEG